MNQRVALVTGIREFAQLAGVTVRALHHYDRLGLLQPRRTQQRYRAYGSKDLEILEQIVALVTALRLFAAGKYHDLVAGYRPTLERIAAALQGLPADCSIVDRGDGESFPLVENTLDEKALGRSAFEVCRRLRQGTPPIYVGHGRLHQGKLVVHPMHLDERAAQAVARRIREELAP